MSGNNQVDCCICGSAMTIQRRGRPVPINPEVICSHEFCYFCIIKQLAVNPATTVVQGVEVKLDNISSCPVCRALFDHVVVIQAPIAQDETSSISTIMESAVQDERENIDVEPDANEQEPNNENLSAGNDVARDNPPPVRVGRRWRSAVAAASGELHQCIVCERTYTHRNMKARCKEFHFAPYRCAVRGCKNWFNFKQDCRKHMIRKHKMKINCKDIIGLNDPRRPGAVPRMYR